MSEKLDAELICHWPERTLQRNDFRFEELFEGRPPFTLLHDYPNFKGLATLDDAADGVNVDPDKLATEFVYSTTGIRLLPGEAMSTARAEARDLFSRLTVARPITDAIAEIDRAVPLDCAMAVHVRRGSDIVPLLVDGNIPRSLEEGHIRGYARMFVDLESYRIAVKALGSPKCFIFCPDDADRDEIKRDLDGYTVDEFPSIQRLAPLQRDLAEILIMSRTACLLGPKSNFSGLARLLGNLRLEWVNRWVSARDMVAMVRRDFGSRPDLQVRILKACADWYAPLAPAASAHFAATACEISESISLVAAALPKSATSSI